MTGQPALEADHIRLGNDRTAIDAARGAAGLQWARRGEGQRLAGARDHQRGHGVEAGQVFHHTAGGWVQINHTDGATLLVDPDVQIKGALMG